VNAQLPAGGSPIAGRYTLDRTLGAGAAAVVHAGRDLRTNARVAVKLYRKDGTAIRLQQQRELEALACLDHPGLVTLHDGGTEPGPDGRTYVVTDLVEGPTLAARMQQGPLPVGEIRALALSLAGALAHVHARGFVHRDVKPANILLEHGRDPRLADFGIARALDGTVATATGAVSGTAAYLAPEQVRGEVVGPPADVYALGLVLIEAVTGRREYPGGMVESATARLYRKPVVPSGLPWELAALLHGMTDPDPAARPTAAGVVAALSKRPRVRRRRVGTALAAAGLLGVVVGGISLLDDVPDPAPASVGAVVPVQMTPTPAETPVGFQNPATAADLRL
jgi:serine/threonine protein kinase